MKIFRVFAMAIGLSACLFGVLSATTIRVPGGQPTIQAGIDAAINGDTVMVSNGTYTGIGNRDVDFLGKAIVVMSENGPENTIIDCEGIVSEPHRGFRFSNGEDTNSVLDGFTIINGYNDHGGAIECHYSSPKITNCIFRNNTATDIVYGGGAISLYFSNSIIEGCVIDSNNSIGGGGIFTWEDSPLIYNCLFSHNLATAGGGGIHSHNGSPTIENCTFVFNSAIYGGGIDYYGAYPTINNCIVYSNTAPNGSGIWKGAGGGGIYCSDIYNNDNYGCPATDCFSLAPLFCNISENNYTILNASPCASENNDCNVLIGAYDVGCIVPEVVSTSPSQNGTNVNSSSDITVSFSTDMDETTFNDSTFVVHARSTGLHQGTFSYDGSTRTITFNPNDDFAIGEIVTVVLTEHIKSSQGIPLVSSYVWSFMVKVDGGSGTFAPYTFYGVSEDPKSVFAADFDGDGDLDLATANFWNSDNICILLNNGDGSFAADYFFQVGDGPISIIAADLDADGDLDLTTANAESDNVSILLNNGDGTFASHSDYAVGSNPFSVFAADLNGDGCIDLATANQNSANVSVLLNNGDGSFATHAVFQVGEGVRSIIAADFDGDGNIDLATANQNSNNVSILLNNGDSSFTAQTIYQVGEEPRSITFADFDEDGDLDLATANQNSDNVSVLLNNGDGTFLTDSIFQVGNYPTSVFSGDFDGDGDIDLATANQNSDDVSILLNTGIASFAPHSIYGVGVGPVSVFGADLDGDGCIDLAATCRQNNVVSILLNNTKPNILLIQIDSNDTMQNIISHNPLIGWSYSDPEGKPQTQFEIAVGTDDDWTYAEMWNPAPVQSSDTFVVYNGSSLVDGTTYYLRLRVNNGEVWSEWYETSFHMNSIPSVPIAISPIDNIIVDDNQPTLWIQNSTDGEPDDTLTYEFVVANDTTFGEPDPIWDDSVAEGTDSTGWQVTEPLNENWQYFWSARAFDQYEYSDWSETETFWVNAIEETPGDFETFYPPDTDDVIITDMLSLFWWGEADESDPLDSVYYTLYISIDSDFNFVNTIDSIWTNLYTLTADDSLDFGTHYWWKVKATDNTDRSTYSSNIRDFQTWMLGDANGDLQVNILDVTFLINYLYKGGAPPWPIVMGDIDGSCSINILDVTYLINYLYKSGPAPLVGCE